MKKINCLTVFNGDGRSELDLPYAKEGIKAGFPSPAQDYIDDSIDLNKELIKHPAATFYARVEGNSMKDAGLDNGDILVIDKSLTPRNGDIAVCFIDGEFTVKYIEIHRDHVLLIPANDNYKKTIITPENEFIIWGIVTHTIKSLRK